MLCLLLACLCVTSGAVAAHYQGWPSSLVYLLPAALLGAYAAIGSGSNTCPSQRMQEGARHIAKLFDARWVVMGHTHAPRLEPLHGGHSYVNLGSWGEDELPDERAHSHRSPCTYFVLRHVDGEYVPNLLCWDGKRGPRPFHIEASESAPASTLPAGTMQPT